MILPIKCMLTVPPQNLYISLSCSKPPRRWMISCTEFAFLLYWLRCSWNLPMGRMHAGWDKRIGHSGTVLLPRPLAVGSSRKGMMRTKTSCNPRSEDRYGTLFTDVALQHPTEEGSQVQSLPCSCRLAFLDHDGCNPEISSLRCFPRSSNPIK